MNEGLQQQNASPPASTPAENVEKTTMAGQSENYFAMRLKVHNIAIKTEGERGVIIMRASTASRPIAQMQNVSPKDIQTMSL